MIKKILILSGIFILSPFGQPVFGNENAVKEKLAELARTAIQEKAAAVNLPDALKVEVDKIAADWAEKNVDPDKVYAQIYAGILDEIKSAPEPLKGLIIRDTLGRLGEASLVRLNYPQGDDLHWNLAEVDGELGSIWQSGMANGHPIIFRRSWEGGRSVLPWMAKRAEKFLVSPLTARVDAYGSMTGLLKTFPLNCNATFLKINACVIFSGSTLRLSPL